MTHPRDLLNVSPSVPLDSLESKFIYFISLFKDEDLSIHAKGICNALAFMNFRADWIGQIDKNIERMNILLRYNRQQWKKMAEMYQKYKEARLLLVTGDRNHSITDRAEAIEEEKEQEQKEEKQHKEAILKLNQQIKDYEAVRINPRKALEKLIKKGKTEKLSKEEEDNKKDLEEKTNEIEETIRKIRKERDDLIEEVLSRQFGDQQLKAMHGIEQVYIYTHSVAAAFDPGSDIGLRSSEGRTSNQEDWMDTMTLLGPDEFKEGHVALDVAYLWTKEELIKLFNNQLQDNTFHEGDFIRLSSTDHGMYLKKENGVFKLYNPLPSEVQDGAKGLVDLLEKNFFKDYGCSSTYMPIRIMVLEKNVLEKKWERPSRMELINQLDVSDGLHRQAWDGTTNVLFATRAGHLDTIKALAPTKAELSKPDKKGLTPVEIAAAFGHKNVVKFLADAKVNLNDGRTTPLVAAIPTKQEEMVKYLLNAGANPFREIVGYGTLLDYVKAKGSREIFTILEEFMLNMIKDLAKIMIGKISDYSKTKADPNNRGRIRADNLYKDCRNFISKEEPTLQEAAALATKIFKIVDGVSYSLPSFLYSSSSLSKITKDVVQKNNSFRMFYESKKMIEKISISDKEAKVDVKPEMKTIARSRGSR